jgi:hypothetical protein
MTVPAASASASASPFASASASAFASAIVQPPAFYAATSFSAFILISTAHSCSARARACTGARASTNSRPRWAPLIYKIFKQSNAIFNEKIRQKLTFIGSGHSFAFQYYLCQRNQNVNKVSCGRGFLQGLQ